ncbi:MAG TPA: S53 family peptidase [Candidatus Bathyarchaeia archaeon]|nr:S53 family peptidase [Candidatus Bathyarchaeia archaeon]
MKKILAIITLATAALMLVPVGIITVTASFDYVPGVQYTMLGPLTTQPNGLPLCRSSSLGNIVCYSPSFIKKAYEYPSISTLDGSGQTIVIVDAFGSPTIASDLALFDAVFHIPDPPSFTIFCGNSPTPLDPTTCPTVNINTNPKHDVFGWTIETSLDVQYAHAMAPGANIVLDVAATSSGNALNDAETAAIAAFPGAVFSQSFGIPEIFCVNNPSRCQVGPAQTNYANGVAKGDTFFASAGDTGADFGTGVAMGNFPGTDIHNTAVTGTQGLPYNATGTLQPCPTSTPFSCTSGLSSYHGPCVIGRTVPPNCVADGYGGEQVWNEAQFGAATGGAQSLLFGVPTYQSGLGLSSRGPDVAYNAAIDGGVLVVYGGFGSPVLFIVGGTSAGSPQWAGIIALANQARAMVSKGPIGDLNPVLYNIYHSARYSSDFHDITVGNDQLVGSTVGFAAGTGYDVASGIGSPIVDQLIVDLAAA